MMLFKIFVWMSSIKDAILQIFPTPKATHWSAFSLGCLFLILVTSCSTVKYVPQVVEHTTHDTLYLNHQQYDSTYVHDSSTIDYHIGTIDTLYLTKTGTSLRVDTIYRDRLKTDYKYKLLRDTIYQVRCDSIPMIKEVEVVKTEKYVPPWIKTLAWIGELAILLIVLSVILKLTIR